MALILPISLSSQSGKAIVVEGYMDSITAHAWIKNAVASLGTAFSPEQAKRCSSTPCGRNIFLPMTVMPQDKMPRCELCNCCATWELNVRVVSIPDGKDPDDFIRKHGADAFKSLIENAADFLEFQVSQAY